MIIDYLYFNLYNFYYKDGSCKPTDNPSLRATHVLSMTLLMWVLFGSLLYNWYIFHSMKLLPKYIYFIAYLVCIIPLYFIYYDGKRYNNVYNKYKGLSLKQKKIGFLLSISLIFIPILLMLFFALVLH